MRREKLPILGRNLFTLACLFMAVAWMADVHIATAVVASFVAGYLNEFYLARSIVARIRRAPVEKNRLVLAACGVVLSMLIIGSGFGMVLLLATGVYLVVDAVVLRFR